MTWFFKNREDIRDFGSGNAGMTNVLRTVGKGPAALTFVGALCARVAASVGDWLVLLGERILFTKAPGIFVPKRAENFGTYGRKPLRFLTEETFSFDLMLAGGGLIFLLLYMLL